MLRILSFLLCICVLEGCGVRAPTVRFTGAEVTQSTTEAIALNAEFDISNTNDEPLRLDYYKYTVSAGNHTVYQGISVPNLTIPRWATISSSIPIVIRRDRLPAIGEQVAWKLSGSLSYYPPSAIAETLMNLGIWKPKTTVHAREDLEVPRIN
jgi:hypothetical protein